MVEGVFDNERKLSRPSVINLSQRQDRWHRIQRVLRNAGIDKYSRFEAINGHNVDYTATVAPDILTSLDKPRTDHRTLSRPAIGCYLSHLSLWKRLLAAQEDFAFVLEDDAFPSTVFITMETRSRNDLLNRALHRAGLILLGGNILASARLEGEIDLKRVFYFNGTFAYIITRSAVETLWSHMLPAETHLDHHLSDILMRQPNNVQAISFVRPWFSHDWRNVSNIPGPVDSLHADGQLMQYLIQAKDQLLTHFGLDCTLSEAVWEGYLGISSDAGAQD